MKASLLLLPFFCLLLIWSCTQKAESNPKFHFVAAPDKSIVAKIGDKEVTREQLVKGIEADLYDAERSAYDLKFNRLKALVLETFINNHPKKKNLTNDQFLNRYITKGKEPTEKEIQAFIDEKKIPREHINDQFKQRIKNYLSIEQKRELIDQWLAEQTQKTRVEIYLDRPQRPVFDVHVGESPVLGKANAPVTIVAYSDFQCPHCQKGSALMKDLKSKYGDKVKLVFKHFPMPFHAQAQKAAEASLCAFEQDPKKFWTLHDKFFDDQTKLGKDQIKQTAKQIKLDMGKFTTCLENGKYASRVKEEMAKGKDLGVKATPTFFVNGKLVSGAQPLEVFSEVIETELQGGRG